MEKKDIFNCRQLPGSLYNRVWIDETYIEDYQVLESDNNEKHPRGLSKTKICGHGKPSSKRVLQL